MDDAFYRFHPPVGARQLHPICTDPIDTTEILLFAVAYSTQGSPMGIWSFLGRGQAKAKAGRPRKFQRRVWTLRRRPGSFFWLSPRRRIPCQGMSEESAEKLNPATSAGFKWWRRRESNLPPLLLSCTSEFRPVHLVRVLSDGFPVPYPHLLSRSVTDVGRVLAKCLLRWALKGYLPGCMAGELDTRTLVWYSETRGI